VRSYLDRMLAPPEPEPVPEVAAEATASPPDSAEQLSLL
jgi:hypothetical protein